MEKIKVIIIDDEMLIRKLIRMKMDLEGLNLELAGEYQDGADAIEALQDIRPDIIVSDICMPEVDGLSFSENCIKRFPNIKIIILTGYDDFDYARRGIKAGIFDYLMKPVRADELNATLKKASDEIIRMRQQEEKQKKLLEEMERNIPALRDIYINQILLEEQAADDIERQLETYGVKTNTGKGRGIQVGIIAIKESVSELNLAERILDETKSFYQSDDEVIALRDHWNRIVVLADNIDMPFEECLDILTAIIRKKFDCYVNVGISEIYPCWNDIHSAYVDALDDMKKKRGVKARNGDIHEPKLSGLWGDLTEQIKNGFVEESLEQVGRIFSDPGVSFQEQQKKAMASCQKMYADLEVNQRRVSFDKILKWCCTAEQLKRCVDNIISELLVIRKLERNDRKSELVLRIVKYMLENIRNEALSLNLLAREFSVSNSYISRLLKQFTGRSYGEILSDIRFMRMMEFMNTTSMRDCDIGAQIGINDAHYLSIWFKKVSGCSVTEYRKNISSGSQRKTE